jgi:cyclic pyranopterin phosphate synthase
MDRSKFTHLDGDGKVHMVDISSKAVTRRIAQASCLVVVGRDRRGRETSSGGFNVVQSAKLAGIQAAKRTAELIPLCHPLSLSNVRVDIDEHPRGFAVNSEVVTDGRTGVEMEALTACSYAALALVNAFVEDDPEAHVEDLVLLRKSGGKSGDWGRAVHNTE